MPTGAVRQALRCGGNIVPRHLSRRLPWRHATTRTAAGTRVDNRAPTRKTNALGAASARALRTILPTRGAVHRKATATGGAPAAPTGASSRANGAEVNTAVSKAATT